MLDPVLFGDHSFLLLVTIKHIITSVSTTSALHHILLILVNRFRCHIHDDLVVESTICFEFWRWSTLLLNWNQTLVILIRCMLVHDSVIPFIVLDKRLLKLHLLVMVLDLLHAHVF